MFFVILLINIFLFVIGNIIWTYDLYVVNIFGLSIPILQILLSELSFILLYTLVDKGNIKYGIPFTLLSIVIMIQFLFPLYSFIFFSTSIKYFSVMISIIAIIINSISVRKLLSYGLSQLLSSRVSTSIASIIEVSLFACLLGIGIQGAISTLITRVVYIYLVPRLFFINK